MFIDIEQLSGIVAVTLFRGQFKNSREGLFTSSASC